MQGAMLSTVTGNVVAGIGGAVKIQIKTQIVLDLDRLTSPKVAAHGPYKP